VFVICIMYVNVWYFHLPFFNNLIFVCTSAWKFIIPGKQSSTSNNTRPQASKHDCFCHNVDKFSKCWNNFGMLTYRITSIINAHVQYYVSVCDFVINQI
jgi:hypothetical protein